MANIAAAGGAVFDHDDVDAFTEAMLLVCRSAPLVARPAAARPAPAASSTVVFSRGLQYGSSMDPLSDFTPNLGDSCPISEFKFGML